LTVSWRIVGDSEKARAEFPRHRSREVTSHQLNGERVTLLPCASSLSPAETTPPPRRSSPASRPAAAGAAISRCQDTRPCGRN